MLIIIIAILAILVIWGISVQNTLVKADETCNNALKQINVQQMSRFDAIQALVKLTREYSQYESETLQKVIEARGGMISKPNPTVDDIAHNESILTEISSKLIAVAEAYPELKANENTLKQYPFNFVLRVSHEITEEGYTTTYHVSNCDSRDMFFCIGGHAGYLVDNSCEDYVLKFEKPEDLDMYYTDEKSLFSDSYKLDKRITGDTYEICYKDFDVDAIVLKHPASKKVCLVKKSDGTGMEFCYDGFENLTLWTPPKLQAPFFCLEPWNGLPAYTDETGNFEDKPGAIKLEPGKEYEVSYSIRCIK